METSKSPNYAIPGAIVIAGVLIAGSLYFGRSNPPSQAYNQNGAAQPQEPGLSRDEMVAKLIKNVPPANEADHNVGNPRAKVAVIEYSDIECPFCQRFHATMQKITADYAKSGNLVWVYRHFPLDGHPDAYPEALATECVAAEYGNVKFWSFLNEMMASVANQSDKSVVDKIKSAADKLSLDSAKILSCTDAQTFKQKIANFRAEALALGLGQNDTGTPFSIIVAGNKQYFIDGAQPYEAVKALIDKALAN